MDEKPIAYILQLSYWATRHYIEFKDLYNIVLVSIAMIKRPTIMSV